VLEVPLVRSQVVQLEYFQELWRMKELVDKNFKQRGTHGSNGKLNMDMHRFAGQENVEIQ
jgi:hypothetical protein